MLYIVSTPIGNLADLSFRAVAVLKSCDYILCEDTRHSKHLLNHYEIHIPLKSFHKFNEGKQREEILENLIQGKNIGLISDAGTPLIADPGESLVKECREKGVAVSAIPGACAFLMALTLSGFPSTPFQFIGFLPKKESEITHEIQKILTYPGTTACYETPHRILKTLKLLKEIDGDRKLCIARELTKLYEELLFGTAAELLSHFDQAEPRGEMVLLFSPPEEGSNSFEHLSLEEHVAQLQKQFSLSTSEAIKLAAELRGIPKRTVYNAIHQKG